MSIRDPEKLKEYNRAYYQKNKAKILSQDKEDYKHNHKNVRTKYYLRQYGITVEEYEHMFDNVSLLQNAIGYLHDNNSSNS